MSAADAGRKARRHTTAQAALVWGTIVVLLPWTWFLFRDVHPRMDTIALGLPAILAAVMVACILAGALRPGWRCLAGLSALSWFLFGVIAIVGPWVPTNNTDPVGGFRVVAANTYGSRPEPREILADLSATDADIVVIGELSSEIDDGLTRVFDNVVRSKPFGRSEKQDVGVYTDLPVTDLGLPPELDASRGVRIRVETQSGPVVVYGMHPAPPRLRPTGYPEVTVRRHTRMITLLRDAVAAETLPVVVAGDLNLVDRASGYRRLTALLDDAIRDGWARPTSLRTSGRLLLARVDHVFMPAGWCSAESSIFTLAGSDHRGVAATIGLCP